MRNLKKVLSLALAMVMLVGMMVVGAGAVDATEYPDYGDVSADKQEAVQVITALSVMDGTEKGMEPQATLNRAMAATIIARTLLGRTVADALSSNTCIFTDVPDWAKGAVQYCADMGIVYGIGNNLFGSSNPVKGTEFAAMLLRAVDPDGDYSGESWASKVIVAANKNGLSANIPVTATELTREGAAQMAFNTITEYSPSGAKGYTSDNAPGVVFDSWIEAYVASGGTPSDVSKIHSAKNDTLAKTVFGLTETTDTDKFGRDFKAWKLDGEDDPIVVTDTYVTAPTKTFTAEFDEDDLKDYSIDTTVGSDNTLDKENVIINGVPEGNSGVSTYDTKAKIVNLGGNGVEVSIYVTGKKITKVIVVEDRFGTVSRVNEASGDNKRSVTVAGMKFETESFEKGDVVIYTVADKAIQTMELAEVVESTSVSSARADRVNTGAGTFYYHKGHSVAANDWNFDGTYDLYLDSYGYIIDSKLVEGEAAAPQYALVTRLAKNGFDWIAMLVLPDGSNTRVTLTTDSWKNSNAEINAGGTPVLVSFTEDNGEYKLSTDNTVADTTIEAATTIIDSGKATVDGFTGIRTANNSTLFFVKNTGTDKYSVYQGIRNVPTLKTLAGKTTTGAAIKTSSTSTVAAAIYVDASNTDNVSNSGSSTSASIFVLGNDSGVIRDSVKGNHYTYVALVDGEIVDEFDVKGQVTAATLYNTVSYDKNDVATLSGVVGSVTGTVEPKGDVVVIGGTGYTYDDDTLVFYVENKDLTPSSVNAIESDSNDKAWVVANSGKASTIIIEKQDDAAIDPDDDTNTIVSGSTEVAAPENGTTVTVTGTPSNPTEAKVNGDVKGAVDAGANTTVEIKGGVTATGDVTANPNSTVTISGDVAVGGTVGSETPTVTVAGGDVTIEGTIAAGAVEVKAGELTVTEVPEAGAITVSAVTAPVVINVNAPSADKDVVLAAIDVTSASASSATPVTIKINGNVVQELARARTVTPYTIPAYVKVEVTGNVEKGAAIVIEDGGELTVNGEVKAGADITTKSQTGFKVGTNGKVNEAITLALDDTTGVELTEIEQHIVYKIRGTQDVGYAWPEASDVDVDTVLVNIKTGAQPDEVGENTGHWTAYSVADGTTTQLFKTEMTDVHVGSLGMQLWYYSLTNPTNGSSEPVTPNPTVEGTHYTVTIIDGTDTTHTCGFTAWAGTTPSAS